MPSSDQVVVESPAEGPLPDGATLRVETKWEGDTFVLSVVKPVTYEELTQLVQGALSGLRTGLFTDWAKELKKHNLLEVESFQRAYARYQAAQKAKDDSAVPAAH